MKEINEFYEVAMNPMRYARQIKGQGRKIAGFFCSYTPEEIIQASGFHPMRIFGSKVDISAADAHLQAYCCSLARGALADMLDKRLEFLDATVFPHSCDTMQRLSDIWRINSGYEGFFDVVLPVKLNTQSSVDYMMAVLAKFRREFEETFSLTISDDALEEAIDVFNRIRTSLKAVYKIHSKNPGLINARDIYVLTRGSMVMDRALAADRLEKIVDQLGSQTGNIGENSGKRIVLSGSIIDSPDIYDILSRSGALVVWDDLCTGSRYFEGLVSIQKAPMEAIAERYMSRLICPAKHMSITKRAEDIIRMVQDNDARGVIFLFLKFCDPHSFDYPYIRDALKDKGILSMLFEMEDDLPSEGQLMTRFETFMEII